MQPHDTTSVLQYGTCQNPACKITFTFYPSASAGKFCSVACYLVTPRPRRSLSERFWAKIDKNGPVPVHCPELGPCWVWTGIGPTEYGCIGSGGTGGRDGVTLPAHRVGYELQVGPIPDGLDVCHHCDNPPCCRGSHLFVGTRQVNMADATAKGRIPRGSSRPNAKLTETQIVAIRAEYASGGTSESALGQRYGVSRSAINRILRGTLWGHVKA